MTKAEAIMQEAFAVANAAFPAKVWRARSAAFGNSELPAWNIKSGTDESINHAQGVRRHELLANFELSVAPQDSVETVADALVVTLHEALMSSVTLKNLTAHYEYKTRNWQHEGADGDALQLTVQYLFYYLSPVGSL